MTIDYHGLPWMFMVTQPWSNMVNHVLLNGNTVSRLTPWLTMDFYPWKTMVDQNQKIKSSWWCHEYWLTTVLWLLYCSKWCKNLASINKTKSFYMPSLSTSVHGCSIYGLSLHENAVSNLSSTVSQPHRGVDIGQRSA